jgi:ribosome-binding factor A
MGSKRVPRLNSLLKEVFSEVLQKDVHHVIGANVLVTIMSVDITADLSSAKIYISVIGDDKAKKNACNILNDHAGQIARAASKKVVMRIFPKIHFYLDEGLEKQLRICEILEKVSPTTSEGEPT